MTDRQTDRRTDRILLAIPRLHYMQRGKKVTIALHCHLRLQDRLVVLSFDHDTNAPVCIFYVPNFSEIGQCVDELLRFNTFSRPIFWGETDLYTAISSERSGLNYTKFVEDM